MNALTIRNFRCFLDPGEVPLKPLTVLVGENSTGKSSFLAAIRLAWDLAYGFRRIDFNEEPFLLGAFDQIAHFRGGRAGRAQSFELGFESRIRLRARKRGSKASARFRVFSGAEFSRSGAHPAIRKQVLRCGEYHFTITFPEGSARPRLAIQAGEREASFTLDEEGFRIRLGVEEPIDWRYILYAVSDLRLKHGQPVAEKTALTRHDVAEIEDILLSARFGLTGRPIAIAPVRTRPQRTYNPVSETPLPEGGHVPMVLAKTFFESKDRWVVLKDALDRFGAESGLFSSLDIKGLGRHESDPFQIRVKIEGPPANLVDVGYGVSQVLPILVDSLLADRGDFYLLQQPEVHLHPRAQAALGSFLGSLVAEQSKRFVVETHSDYLLDRIRMDIRDNGVLKPEDVTILFFERQGIQVAIHALQIDENGDLGNVPAAYRDFFLGEERRFLGV